MGKVLGFYSLLFLVPIVMLDAHHFHDLKLREVKSPWFDAVWWKAPYTHAVLSFLPSKTYWTMNAIKSERWLVKEVVSGDTTFWTVLERHSVKGSH
ncbi:MAG: hypothetical protein ACTS9Y_00460 [Methylophilus sp.]|uniref:hypothetical protein n=1 Tax=Methylophilus sp. TaxID=29541 RepID=UPI003F9FF93C